MFSSKELFWEIWFIFWWKKGYRFVMKLLASVCKVLQEWLKASSWLTPTSRLNFVWGTFLYFGKKNQINWQNIIQLNCGEVISVNPSFFERTTFNFNKSDDPWWWNLSTKALQTSNMESFATIVNGSSELLTIVPKLFFLDVHRMSLYAF